VLAIWGGKAAIEDGLSSYAVNMHCRILT